MIILFLGIIIFLQLLEYLVLFDVLSSWLMLLGIRFRPKFIADILDPIYKLIRKFIPTQIGAFDFTAIIVILAIFLLRIILLKLFPGMEQAMLELLPS